MKLSQLETLLKTIKAHAGNPDPEIVFWLSSEAEAAHRSRGRTLFIDLEPDTLPPQVNCVVSGPNKGRYDWPLKLANQT